MSETKLLPCPFCGDAPKHSEHVGGSASMWCAECGIAIDGDGQADAAARWNRRADLGETVARAWAVANAAAREAAELRRAPTDAERADMRDVIAAHERANERMRQEARELTERLALVTKQRDEAEARAQAVVAQVAASTHGHSEAGTMVATNERGEVMAVVQRQVEALSEDRDEPRMRAPGERWWRIHRAAHRVELMISEPPMEPRCIGSVTPLVGARWTWRGIDLTVNSGMLREVMRSVEIALRRGVLAEEVVP